MLIENFKFSAGETEGRKSLDLEGDITFRNTVVRVKFFDLNNKRFEKTQDKAAFTKAIIVSTEEDITEELMKVIDGEA